MKKSNAVLCCAAYLFFCSALLAQTDTLPRRAFKNDGVAQSFALNGDGHWLAVAENQGVNIFHTRTGLKVRTMETHTHAVTFVAANPRKRAFLSGDRHGKLILWNIDDLKIAMRYETPKDSITQCRFSPDGEKFIAVTRNANHLLLFDILTDKPLLKPRKLVSKVLDVDIDAVKNKFATAHTNGMVQLWKQSGDSLALVKSFKAHQEDVMALRYFKNGNFVTVSIDNTLRFWQASGEPLKTVNVNEILHSLDISPDNKWIALGTASGKTIIMDAIDFKVKATFAATPSVSKVIFHPTEPLVATLYGDNTVKTWLLRDILD